MTCLSPQTILLQRTTQSNLKFQCKIHERTRGPEAGGLKIFTMQSSGTATQACFSIMKHIVAHGLSRSEEQVFCTFMPVLLLTLHYISMSDNLLHYRKTCLGRCAGRLHRENILTPLLPVHASFRVFYTETLNCFELFACLG